MSERERERERERGGGEGEREGGGKRQCWINVVLKKVRKRYKLEKQILDRSSCIKKSTS